jgi:D-alanyl-D-alanine dipeptidase
MLRCLAGGMVFIGWMACATAAVETSAARTFSDADLVDVRTLVPDIALDIRYAGTRNFVGSRVDGYEAEKCFLKSQAAQALQRVETQLRSQGLRLKIFDCYRPVRAVQHFVRWAEEIEDQRAKQEYYPNLDKAQLLGEYIAPVSGHSRGATVDLTLMKCNANGCTELDMGTPFDFFDERAHTDHAAITREQRDNRQTLRKAMEREGFENYSAEWWHYTFKPEPTPNLQYDLVVR